MLKLSKLVGAVNLFFTVVLVGSMISALLNGTDNGDLALALASMSILFIAIILTIPFVVILKKKGYADNKFYILTHISLFASSIIALGVSLLIQ